MRHFVVLLAAAVLLMAQAQAQAGRASLEHVAYRTVDINGQQYALIDTVVNEGGRRTACSQQARVIEGAEGAASRGQTVHIEHSCRELVPSLVLNGASAVIR